MPSKKTKFDRLSKYFPTGLSKLVYTYAREWKDELREHIYPQLPHKTQEKMERFKYREADKKFINLWYWLYIDPTHNPDLDLGKYDYPEFIMEHVGREFIIFIDKYLTWNSTLDGGAYDEDETIHELHRLDEDEGIILWSRMDYLKLMSFKDPLVDQMKLHDFGQIMFSCLILLMYRQKILRK